MTLMADVNAYAPQIPEFTSPFFESVAVSENQKMLLLPDPITNDLFGVMNAINHNIEINKFMFQGVPGTGKTKRLSNWQEFLTGNYLWWIFLPLLTVSKGRRRRI